VIVEIRRKDVLLIADDQSQNEDSAPRAHAAETNRCVLARSGGLKAPLQRQAGTGADHQDQKTSTDECDPGTRPGVRTRRGRCALGSERRRHWFRRRWLRSCVGRGRRLLTVMGALVCRRRGSGLRSGSRRRCGGRRARRSRRSGRALSARRMRRDPSSKKRWIRVPPAGTRAVLARGLVRSRGFATRACDREAVLLSSRRTGVHMDPRRTATTRGHRSAWQQEHACQQACAEESPHPPSAYAILAAGLNWMPRMIARWPDPERATQSKGRSDRGRGHARRTTLRR
jgi:hypothetical protein